MRAAAHLLVSLTTLGGLLRPQVFGLLMLIFFTTFNDGRFGGLTNAREFVTTLLSFDDGIVGNRGCFARFGGSEQQWQGHGGDELGSMQDDLSINF